MGVDTKFLGPGLVNGFSMGSKGPTPPPIPVPPPSANPPTSGSASVNAAAQQAKNRASAAAAASTDTTGPQGLTAPASTAKATLLGGSK